MSSIVLKSGRRITLDYDELEESPREWGNYSRLLCISNRHFSLDENLTQTELSDEHREALERGDYVFPLFACVGSGVSFSIRPYLNRWDSGQCGIAIVPKENAKNECQAENIVTSEIEELNTYLSGGVYAVCVEHPEGFNVICDASIGGLLYITDDDIGYLKSILVDLGLTADELNEAKSRAAELMP